MKLRRSGIEVVGDVPWSTHFCQFYQSKEDLVELLVPYFKAGLEDNEFCMWITSEPLGVEEAQQVLEDALPGLNTLLEKGQMEILSYSEWYLQGGDFNPELVLEGWVDRLNQARLRGFDGLRLSGNTFWLEDDIWDDFIHYEDMVNKVIGRYPMMALCTYSLDKCSASEILDVINTHKFTMARREGKWQIMQGVDHSQLDLQNKMEAAFSSINEAMITTDTEGNIIDMNEAFAHFHRFKSLDECSHHLDDYPHLFNVYWPDGSLAPPEEWAVPRALEGEQASNIEFIIERTDTGELWHSSYSFAPIRNSEDEITGTVVLMRDTSPTKQRELELKRVNERLNIASRAAGAGIWDWNMETGEIEWSPVMFELLGLDPQNTKASFEAWESIIHPEDLKKTGERINNAVENHTFLDNLYRIIKPDGEIRWINALGQTGYDQEDRPLWMTGICLDITDRWEMELKYRELVQNASSIIIRWDLKGRINFFNEYAEEIFGYSAPEVLGQSVMDVIVPRKDSSGAVLGNIVQDILETPEQFTVNENENITKDGKRIWIRWINKPIYDGQGRIQEVLAVGMDITQRVHAEKRLKETLDNLEKLVEERARELKISNEYNRNLIETALDPLVTIGANGKITDVNKATEHATGLSREELIGTDFADYFTQPEEAKEGYQQVFQDGEVKDYPLEIKHQDGTITPVLYNAAVYHDEQGEVMGIFAAARDITERKQAEEELRRYWESLEEQVRLRTEELARSNSDLQQFAYIASHDLREPLRMITNFLQLLERRYKDQLDQDAQEFISFAVDGAKRLDKMIISLLDFSRVANQEILHIEVDFQDVIQEVIFNLDVLLKENQAQIEYQNLPTLQADKNLMVRLFQNLISNSIKYRREEPPLIQIHASVEGDNVVFSVRDNGIGIDPQHLDSIFIIFRRLHNHEQYPGTGIGLAIAQRIVHQHGGEIWAESDGEGSTFYFTMPK
jgi:PAS domain S-box-containing protein